MKKNSFKKIAIYFSFLCVNVHRPEGSMSLLCAMKWDEHEMQLGRRIFER